MSDILAAMAAYLQTDPALTVLVGTRVYPMRLPDGSTDNPNVFPALTYQLIDEPVVITHDRKTIYKTRIQLDVWAVSYKSAHAVSDALHAALHGYSGSWSPFVIGGVFRKRKNDLSEPDAGLERVSMDYAVNYREE